MKTDTKHDASFSSKRSISNSCPELTDSEFCKLEKCLYLEPFYFNIMKKIQSIFRDETFIGIDVAKDSLEVFVDSTNKHLSYKNEMEDLERLAKELKELNPKLIVLEATGGYERRPCEVFTRFELPYSVVYPRRVRQFAHSLGVAKTDRIDSKVIAYYGRVACVEAKAGQSEDLEELKALTERRRQLIEMRIMEENRLETSCRKLSEKIKGHLDWLNLQIKEIELEIKLQLEESESFKQIDDLLQSVPGVGRVLSSTLITELPELGNIENKSISSLVGVAPVAHDSGKWSGKRFCQGGRNSIRRVLYMATLSAIRVNPVIKNFYQRLCEKGKVKKVAIIACARKLLCILNTMVRNNSLWQPNITAISS